MRYLIALPLISALAVAAPALADVPFGWIGNHHVNAYSLGAGDFALSGNFAAVNDTIDFLNLRDRLLAGSQRLVGNSGDLSSTGGELRVGVWPSIELFYRENNQSLTLNLGTISSADVENLDNQLRTHTQAYGAKWVFYDAINQDRSYPWTSAALELTSNRSHSDDFGGYLAGLRTSATGGVFFDPPGRFALDRLQDDAWQARLLLSSALGNTTTATFWAGYGEANASSGTSWDIDIAFLRDAFLQTFDTEETQYSLGMSLNWQYLPRLPVQIGYEYINIADRQVNITQGSGRFSNYLPSFLRGDQLSESETRNHTLYGSVSWWVTPEIFIGAGGKLFSSQLTGIIPHYTNPLSGSFSDTNYGYLELKMGMRFSLNWR